MPPFLPRKRAGRDFGPPEDRIDRGAKTCTSCNGTGEQDRPQAEQDEDGIFDGAARIRCGDCGGTGEVTGR